MYLIRLFDALIPAPALYLRRSLHIRAAFAFLLLVASALSFTVSFSWLFSVAWMDPCRFAISLYCFYHVVFADFSMSRDTKTVFYIRR